MKRSLILIWTVCCMAAWPAAAQNKPDTTLAAAEALIREVQAALSEKPVSFQVRYVYTNENTPGQLLDSVSGSIDMDGAKYHCRLDNTETICNGKYNIVLFRDDKVMYLARPGADSAAMDPVSAMIFAFRSAGARNSELTGDANERQLRISFNDDAPYRQIDIVVDNATRRLKSVSYAVKTQALMEKGEEAPSEGYEAYARVRADFFNYRYTNADVGRYDETHYFVRNGSEFKPASAFNDYTIFIGTPNL